MRFLIMVVLLFAGFVVYRKEASGIVYCKSVEDIWVANRTLECDFVQPSPQSESMRVLCSKVREVEYRSEDEANDRLLSGQSGWCNAWLCFLCNAK